MLLPFLTAMMLAGAGTPPSPACTKGMVLWFERDPEVGFVILRATTDSILDGEYFHEDRMPTKTPAQPRGEARPVFGQLFEVVAVGEEQRDEVEGHERAVLVWWSVGLFCERWFPRRSREVTEGVELFVAKRPRDPADWIDGIPTYDVEFGDWLYHAGERRPDDRTIGSLTAAEYAELYELWPEVGASRETAIASLESIIRWGAAAPGRWDLWPARLVLCQAADRLRGYGRMEESPAVRDGCRPRVEHRPPI